MKAAGVVTAGAPVAVAVVGREEEGASPALGGGGTEDCDPGVGTVEVGVGTAPGWGAGGDCEDVVGNVVVGVAER